MELVDYVIVGGGPAGNAAAASIRQHDADGRIVVIGKEDHPLYSRPALTAYMRGEASRDSLYLHDQTFYDNNRIEYRRGAGAVGVDVPSKVITLTDGTTVQYDKLLIATGGRPRAWKVSGVQLDGVCSLRTIDQAEETISRIKQAKHVTVVGGGFITLELVQLLARIGVATTVVLRGPYYWSNVLDEESGRLIHQLMMAYPSVDIVYGTEVAEVVGHAKVEAVVLSNGKKLKTDAVLVNIGISFNVEWLGGSGITLENGVVVNQYLETDVPDVYAAGDLALFYDPLIELYHQQGNWSNATLQGQIAGQNMTGHKAEFAAVTSYSVHLMKTDISFIGQTSLRSSLTAVPRGSARTGAYGRILLRSGQVVGATLINRFVDRDPIQRLISSQIKVDRYIAALADESISLKDVANALGV